MNKTNGAPITSEFSLNDMKKEQTRNIPESSSELVMAFIKNNSTAFAFSLDALLDCASSAVVIWRYWGSAASLYSLKRERIACIILGVLFIASFISICTRSTFSLISQEHPRRSHTLWVISVINVVVCIGLMVSKGVLASKLESITIATDAVNSGIGFIMAVSTVVSDLIYNNTTSVWYVDTLIGMICSVFLLAYGIWVIIYQTCLVKSNEVG
ncbi:hypothetical protein LSH36_202g10013 [Paralvinella palmiformis]|uniref:Transmembrane protein 163 n=1 Tax=Paralvinella palmiformis TaxID=53620 RepID=A0AAD9N4Y4_9ANNE|nr:hypothetical protein LSH36_202g10013 [Paralvinella palmiformis]